MKVYSVILGVTLGALALFSCASPTSDVAKTSTPAPSSLVTASVKGRVLDNTYSKPVAGAIVTVGSQTAVTGDDGLYSVDGVKSGQYLITVKKSDASAASYTLMSLGSVHVMTLDEFRDAVLEGGPTSVPVIPLPNGATVGNATNVASNFDATSYSYTVTTPDLWIAPNNATLAGKAYEQIDNATQVNAVVAPKGTALYLQTALNGQDLVWTTTVSDDQGSFQFTKLPAILLSGSGDSPDTFGLNSAVTVTSGTTNWSNSTWRDQVYLYPATTVTLGTPLYFAVASKTALKLVSTNTADSQYVGATNFAVTTAPTFTFNNALTKVNTQATALRRMDNTLVDSVASISGNTLTVTPAAPLLAGTQYYVEYSVTDGVSTVTSSDPDSAFQTVGTAATAVTDLALDPAALLGAKGRTTYDSSDTFVYFKFTADPTTVYSAQWKLGTDSSWTGSSSTTINTRSGTTAYASADIGPWTSGQTVQVRLVAQRVSRSVANIGDAAVSAPITVVDATAPVAGSVAAVPFAASMNISETIDLAPTSTADGQVYFSVSLTGGEVLGAVNFSSLSAGLGTYDVRFDPTHKVATVYMAALKGTSTSAQSFNLGVSDGAGNFYASPIVVHFAN